MEAFVNLATAMVVLITILVSSVVQTRKLSVVHTLVNSKMTAALRRIEQLTRALKQAGVRVPDLPDDTS